jgi:hypothetical protein
MRLCDLASVKSWLPNNSTSSDRLWRREACAVSEGEIQLFYARCGLLGLRSQAIDAIDALQAAVILSSFNHELHEAPSAIILHESPPEPYFVDELVSSLIKLRPARRQACLFALEMQCEPTDALNLTWKSALEMQQLPPLCVEVLQSAGRTRHLKLPYVFWEWASVQIAAPLLELQWSIERAFECSWPELTRRYGRIVHLHRGAESASLLELSAGIG